MSTLGGGLVAQPAGMGGGGRRLKEYQLVGLNWLRLMWRMELGCILADEMGLGKTIQLIALLAALRAGGEARPHLVVAPASVLDNWLRELRAWCPSLRAAKYHGPQAERYALQERLDDDGFDVLLTTYSYFEGDSAAQRDDRAWLGRKEWGCCVFDEAHALKRGGSNRAERLGRLRSRQRVLLTGTPVQNNVNELLSLLSFMLPATFPPELALAFADASSSRARLSDAEVGRLRRLLAPFILRRLKAHVLTQLVPKVEEEALVEMSPRQRLVYEKILRAHAKARKQRDGGGRDAPPKREARRGGAAAAAAATRARRCRAASSRRSSSSFGRRRTTRACRASG